MILKKTSSNIIFVNRTIPGILKKFRRCSIGLWILTVSAYGQNSATASGNWSSCTTWGNPQAIYRNTTDNKAISNGITVTADVNWSTAAILLNGNGAVNYNPGIFTDFANDQGDDVSCIPPVPAPDFSASYSYLCHSQRNTAFVTRNGFTVTPSVNGNIYEVTYDSYGVSSLCGKPVCNSNSVSGNFVPVPNPSTVTISFSRPVSNIRLIITALSDDEIFTVTTNGGTPVLSSCSGISISGNTFRGASAVPSAYDVGIGEVWYDSVTLTTIQGFVYIGYGYSAASSY
ncbi:hypothetical protein [uncultured Chryseobacterium sp.]|uniref:hypothetical protein n=1 Tax=uncultured Chryseobacterium sp. TaxID=259322 RepID=UPI0025F9D8C5|nr:hypothetical protein [uncultured Chryseobacterium sp.]